mmetsp:Transcript_16211/g.24028  ORF Transcript_16211/g.24028 Transcript_16211/m.24028 type:complete len:576 (-) Transcript_16211:473-2200(-)
MKDNGHRSARLPFTTPKKYSLSIPVETVGEEDIEGTAGAMVNGGFGHSGFIVHIPDNSKHTDDVVSVITAQDIQSYYDDASAQDEEAEIKSTDHVSVVKKIGSVVFSSSSTTQQSSKEEEDIDLSSIEIMHIDDLKDSRFRISDAFYDKKTRRCKKKKKKKKELMIDVSDSQCDYDKCDSNTFTGMIISPPCYNEAEFLREKFRHVLVFGIFSVCILGSVVIFLSSQYHNSVPTSKDTDSADLKHLSPPESLGVSLPLEIEQHFSDWIEEDDNETRNDVPVFWSIPLTGNNAIEEYLGGCLGLTQASEIGIIGNGEDDEDSLKMVKVHGLSYLNVDLRTKHGIEHAKELHLVDKHSSASLTPDVVHTPLLYESAQLFENPEMKQGKIVVILRDPLERAVALYRRIRMIAGGKGALSQMTLTDYANSDYVENNWLTRSLCNKPTGPLSIEDLNIAKEIMRKKALVGMYDDVPLALSYLRAIYDWDNEKKTTKENLTTTIKEGNDFTKDSYYHLSHCTTNGLKDAIRRESGGGHGQLLLEEGSLAWKLLKKENEFDIQLFEYAKMIHRYQFREKSGE